MSPIPPTIWVFISTRMLHKIKQKIQHISFAHIKPAKMTTNTFIRPRNLTGDGHFGTHCSSWPQKTVLECFLHFWKLLERCETLGCWWRVKLKWWSDLNILPNQGVDLHLLFPSYNYTSAKLEWTRRMLHWLLAKPNCEQHSSLGGAITQSTLIL